MPTTAQPRAARGATHPRAGVRPQGRPVRRPEQISLIPLADGAGFGEIVVDAFAGGGGVSTGIEWATGRSPDVAVNHDPEAIALHAANHPHTRHYCESVWGVNPREVADGRPVGLFWLSPDCKHFSKAKGAKPVSKKIRGLAWLAVRWARAVRPRVIILENVEEFKSWGPLFAADHPDPRLRSRPVPERRGETFRKFVRRLERLGYAVEWRELRACDFGAPTIRKRFFLVARCDGRPIVWPEPTHGPGRAQPWRTAAECIDWSLPCPSIFMTRAEGRAYTRAIGVQVKRPLAPKTLRRVAAGIFRFVLDNPTPFVVPMQHRNAPTAPDAPLQTITTQGNKFNLVVPSLAVLTHGGADRVEAVDAPLRTITAAHRGERAVLAPVVAPVVAPVLAQTAHGDASATATRRGKGDHGVEAPVPTLTASNDLALVAPVLATFYGPKGAGGDRANAVDAPLRTQPTENRFALAAPVLVPRYGERGGQAPRVRRAEAPAPVVVPTANGASLAAAFLAKHYGDRGQRPGSGMEEPTATVTASDHHALVTADLAAPALVEPGQRHGRGQRPAEAPASTVTAKGRKALAAAHLVKFTHNEVGQPVDTPAHTVLAQGEKLGLVRAFLTAYYGSEGAGQRVDRPARTLTGRDRLGVVTVAGVEYAIVDVGMRMLTPRELYRCQGFGDDYLIDIPHRDKPLSKTAQVRMCGNSVPPQLAEAMVASNYGAVTTPVRAGRGRRGAGPWRRGAAVALGGAVA